MRNLIKVLLLAGVYFLMAIPVAGEPPTGINLGHDYTFQFVTGDLTSTVQYSTVVNTTTAGADVTLFSKSIDLIFGIAPDGRTASHKFLIGCYFNIITEIRSVSTGTADVEWKPQARNKDGTWTDLASYVDLPDVGASYTQSVLKGYAEISDTFDEMPFDFRILIKCDEVNEGRGRVKSGSYVRAIFKDITWGVE